MTVGKPAPEGRKIAAGLHLVATPIGAARDITLRALDILAEADVLAAEDTRTLRHLMEIHGIALNGRSMIAYHDHNGAAARPRLLGLLREGKSVAYASEAGTPLVADPGFQLARAAIAEGVAVLAAPGASAVLCALTVSGLPSDRFTFLGFLPPKSAARKTALREVKDWGSSLIIYESARRLTGCLADLVGVLGGDRQAAVCRELTKKFEEITRGSLADLLAVFSDRDVKGEIVIVVDRGAVAVTSDQDVESALQDALQSLSVKEAAQQVAEKFGMSKRDAYQMALKLGDQE
ncbi:MAG: 16S rRNA (cytidine(1402)-2'-O)-methyltransferase [Pseudorhodobacter sp.]|nr:16S rRNA (cytidine(1402)-2'-O)-methyltransferase [Pseudorhodobacter sp.]